MSCHDIGRGLNSVVRATITLRDEGKISSEAAKIIINHCKRGVHWCDGNESEATAYIRHCICGRCMKKVPKGEKLYSVEDVSYDVPDQYRLAYNNATDCLCPECFDIGLNEWCKDMNAGARERAYIEKKLDPKYYTSTGEYSDDNNGYDW